MSEDCCSCLDSCCFFNSLRHIDGITDSLCIDDDVILFTAFFVLQNIFDQRLLIIVFFFRKKNLFCSVGNTAPQRKVSCITSHYLNDTASLVWSRCITDLIDRFHSCIDSCIKSNRIICTCNVKIDRSRKSNRIYSEVRQLLCSGKRSVSSDYYKTVNSVFFTNCCCFLLSFFCTHCLAACCLKNCTTSLDDIRHIACRQINDLFF